MSKGASTNKKKLTLIDAVEWSDAYPPASPLKNVSQWFTRHLGDLPIQIETVSAREAASASEMAADAIIYSGSPRDAWVDDDFTLKAMDMIRRIRERKIPFLGVCYGHQLLARALGGDVQLAPNGLEVGNSIVYLTHQGQQSPLFAGYGRTLSVLQSHRDAVINLPRGAALLAANDHSPVQAFSFEDRMFGVQFHPETSPDVLQFIWQPRRENYRDTTGFNLDAALDQMKPTPDAPQLIRNFVKTSLAV